jgi:ribose-phosphate pyrophosphokinase
VRRFADEEVFVEINENVRGEAVFVIQSSSYPATDNLFASPVIATDIRARFGNRDLLVVSPDVGGVVRARGLAKRLDNAPLEIVDKRRERAGESEVLYIIGDVDGRTCVLVDDIVDSAGTLCNAAAALKQEGATEVFAYCSHGVLSGGAAARVAKSELSELVVTDTIWTGEADPKGGKIRRLTVAPLLGEAIKRISDEASVSSLFD